MSKAYTIAMHAVILQTVDPIAVDVNGETLILNVQRGNYYGLGQVGSRVWQLIREPRSLSEICDVLQAEFDVDRPRCEREVMAFVRHLAEHDLVRLVGNSETGHDAGAQKGS